MKVYDPQGNEHDKEPIDARECVADLGWSYERPGSAEILPAAETMGAVLPGGDTASSPKKRGRPPKAVDSGDGEVTGDGDSSDGADS